MENKKAKKLLIIILIILLLVCLGVILWQYIKLDKIISNQEKITNEINNRPTESEKEGNNKENVDLTQNDIKSEENEKGETKLDPYENYKDVKWCGKKDNYIEIKENKVVITYDEKYTLTLPKDKPKSVAMCISGGAPVFYVLGESGNVYYINEDEANKCVKNEKIENYKIIAMTTSKPGINTRSIYFLTDKGLLIDYYGITYEENNKDLKAELGHYFPIYFNNEGNVIYENYKNHKKYYINDTKENKIVAKFVFWQSSTINNDLADNDISERYIIITNNNQLVYFTTEYETIYEKEEVKTYKLVPVYDEEWDYYRTNLEITFVSGKVITIADILDSYYDVVKNESIEIEHSGKNK